MQDKCRIIPNRLGNYVESTFLNILNVFTKTVAAEKMSAQ